MRSVYVVEVEKVHHLLTHIEWIDLFEEINLAIMLLQNHVIFRISHCVCAGST